MKPAAPVTNIVLVMHEFRLELMIAIGFSRESGAVLRGNALLVVPRCSTSFEVLQYRRLLRQIQRRSPRKVHLVPEPTNPKGSRFDPLIASEQAVAHAMDLPLEMFLS